MTYEQLKERFIGKSFAGYGHFKVSFNYRSRDISCTTADTMAIDRLNDENEGRVNEGFYTTKKQALQSLYNECKRANGYN